MLLYNFSNKFFHILMFLLKYRHSEQGDVQNNADLGPEAAV